MWTPLVWAATWDHVDVQGLHRADPVPHPSLAVALPAPHLRTAELALVAWVWESWESNQPGYHPDLDPGL